MSDKHHDPGPVDGGSVPIESAPDRRHEVLQDDPTAEATLEMAFAEVLAPSFPDATTEPLLAELADAMSGLTTAVPMESRHRAMAATKRAVHQLTTWYQDQLLAQTRTVNASLVRALHDLDRRISDLEVIAAPAALGGRAEILLAEPDELPSDVVDAIVGALASASPIAGRVLHAEAGRGALVRALRATGCDAYGADPWLPPAGTASDAVWQVAVLQHLGALPAASLGGVVLSGIVDTAPVEERLDALREASRTVAPGGRVVIITETPESDASRPRTGRRDLRPDRPLTAATWVRLLALHGLASGPPSRVRTDSLEADVLDATRHA